ncbi:uncharacterized protein [Gossypium hirsutum]|uniref:CCHC-type domain-containing protein n=1 Tax=Gossypium hirsutum TaxID=3635 RepID=A0A1U8KXR3_GOSHI|nr:uncharacterized protein LOC107921915 [Gossypium hirsutum]
MCKRFVNGLNEYIKLLTGILEIKEFVVLVERASKAEDYSKEKRKADFEARDSRKRLTSKSYQSTMKKFRDSFICSNTSARRSNRDREKQPTGSRAQATSVASVGSVRQNRPKCGYCGNRHSGDYRYKERACFKCGSLEHFIKDCPYLAKKDNVPSARPSNTATRGRPPRNLENVSGSQRVTKDSTLRSEARALTQAYAIRAREDASSPDIITGIFTLYDTKVIALIDPGSNHFQSNVVTV